MPSSDAPAGEAEGRELLERLRRLSRHPSRRERYREIEEIGRGGMGRVLRVHDLDLERDLALKEIHLAEQSPQSAEERDRHERLLSRFLFEARITSRLQHPGIVPVHDIGIDARGALYFTMPLVRGRTLEEVFALARAGREGWSVQGALWVLVQVARIVAYAHSRGVIHRDLTPRNVMVGTFGEVMVLDWGLALLEGREERGAVVGTPAYMPPEQAAGTAPVDERADVYALGAMLYELLSARMPHATTLGEGAPEGGVGALALHAPRPLRELAPDAPPELDAICAKAMAARPSQRYPTASELGLDLQAWLEGRVVRAHDTGRWTRLKKWRERNGRLVLALEALLLVTALASAAVLAQQRSKLVAVAAERAEVARKDYATRLKAAELSLEQGGWGEARGLLEGCPEELRDWSWRHLAYRSDPSLRRFEGHTETVEAVALRADGSRLATGSRDRTIGLWDPGSGARIARLEGHVEPVSALAFAPDEALLASVSEDGALRLWDASTGAFARFLGQHPLARALAFDPDGTRVATGGGDGAVRLWDLEHGLGWERLSASARTVTALGWCDEGTLAAGFSTGELVRLDARSGGAVGETALGSRVNALAVHPREPILAVATLDERVLLLDARTLQRLPPPEDPGGNVRSLAFLSGGARLAMGLTDGSIRVWSRSGEPTVVLQGHGEAVQALAADGRGQRLASGSSDKSARLWAVGPAAASTVALDCDGDVGAAQPVLHLDPDFLVGSRTDGSAFRRSLDGSPAVVRFEGVLSEPCVRPDGELVALCDPRGAIQVFRARDGALERRLVASQREQTELRFDPSGKRLLARGLDSVLRLWDVEEACVLLEVHDPGNNELDGMAFDARGQRFAVSWHGGGVRVFDAERGKLLETLEGGSAEGLSALAFPPRGERLFAGAQDGTILAWRLGSGAPPERLVGHKRGVNALAFSPDGTRLFSGALDGMVRVWDAARGEPLMTLRCGIFGITDVAFDAVHDRLVAADTLHRVHVWATRPGG